MCPPDKQPHRRHLSGRLSRAWPPSPGTWLYQHLDLPRGTARTCWMWTVELFGVIPQPSGGHRGSQITLSNLLLLLITPQLPTERVLTFQHPVLTLSMPNLYPAPDKSGPSQEFLGSFVYSMLGTGVTGCLCISVIGTLFPLEECKLPKCRGLQSAQDGTSPFSQSPWLTVPFWGLCHLHLTLESSTDLSQLSPKRARAETRSYSTSHPTTTWQSPWHRKASQIFAQLHV